MKISFSNSLLNKFKKGKQKKSVIKNERMRTRLYWNILLLTFTILLFSVGAGGYYLYINFVSEEGRIKNDGEDDYTALNTELLDKVLTDFKTRKKISEETLLNPPNIIDPSL